MQSTTPSSSAYEYDVFLSFRGSDTRFGFTGNLYHALHVKGIRTFIDDRELHGGEEITSALFSNIENSRIAIIVFSKDYASSSFCLNELSHIMEFFEENNQLVLPVFYDLDPANVRHQTGSYGEAIAKHEERFQSNKETLQKWKNALNKAANLSGHHFTIGKEYEYEFIRKIVDVVSNTINRTPLHVADYPVGLENRVLTVKGLLKMGSDDGVCIVGIHGIGGIGKTTLAREIYNSIANQFEVLCFLDAVRETTQKLGLVHLQETLLHETIGEKDIKLGSVSRGISIIKQRLQTKKVLLILDDVNKLEQLQVMVGEPNWLGPGSKVIITTRDTQLLASHGIATLYEVTGLNKEEALELLTVKAFKNNKVHSKYEPILKRFVTYASGLPLALVVVGSTLCGKKHIKDWESLLSRYERIPPKDIQKKLKVSFDALEKEEQAVFLDIACCFKGYELKKGASGIKIIHLDFPLSEGKDGKEIEWKGDELKKMENLKTLIIKNGRFSKAPTHIPNSLRVLEWQRYPSPYLPFDFWPKKLSICKLAESCFTSFELPSSLKRFVSIKDLNLDNCQYLKHIYDVSGLTNLERFSFQSCKNLETIHDSVEFRLNKLKLLSARYCSNLKSFPRMKLISLEELDFSGCYSLKSFPEILGEMENIRRIELKFTSIEEFPFSFQNLTGLEWLSLSGRGGMLSLTSSIVMMPKLKRIDASRYSQLFLGHNDDLSSMASSNVEYIKLNECKLSDVFLPLVTWFSKVVGLDLSRSEFTILPECLKECRFLRNLIVTDCKYLQEIRGIPPNLKELSAVGCCSLTSSCRKMLLNQELHEDGGTKFVLDRASDRIPEWFEHQSRGGSISFWFRNKVPSIALCVVTSLLREESRSSRANFRCYANMFINGGFGYRIWYISLDEFFLLDLQLELQDKIYECNLEKELLQNEWIHADVRFEFSFYDEHRMKRSDAMEIGIHVLTQKSSMVDIQFTNPYKETSLGEDFKGSMGDYVSGFDN